MNAKNFFKRKKALSMICVGMVIVVVVLILAIGIAKKQGGSNTDIYTTVFSAEEEQLDTKENSSVIPDIVEEQSSVNFDSTYWNLTFGQTMGTQYIARFHSDGTILAMCTGSGQFSDGTYKYADGKLTISIDSYKNVEFEKVENMFQSLHKHEMQVGEGYYTICSTDGAYFLEHYEEMQQEERLKPMKLVFPDCYKSEERITINDSIKLGRYEGFWVGVDNGYSYLTLREDQTFLIETNVDHVNHKTISPVSFEGEYAAYRREIIYPDNSVGYSTEVILYFEDYVLARYEGEDGYFGDQSSGYEYIDG